MIESARERLSIEGRIRHALDVGEFGAVVSAAGIDLRRNRIAGFEALIQAGSLRANG